MAEEYRTINLADLPPNQMKQVRAGATDVLLINADGVVSAVEPLCPHYKQPLADGLVCGGSLRCGWHQSVFDIASGKLKEPPALHGLQTYPTRVDNGMIVVDTAGYRADRRRFVVVGGGAAGFSAVKTLRDEGFAGDLTLVSADDRPPYDRPNLSKDYLAGKPLDTPMSLATEGFYEENRITLRLGTSVTKIDRVSHAITLDDGSIIPFDSLLIATGGRAKTLHVPGHDLPGVWTLRTNTDADLLIALADEIKHVLIVGGSFIAMEASAALRQRKLNVSVLLREEQPLMSVLGPEIGKMIRTVHERMGVKFIDGKQLARFEGGADLTGAVFNDGTTLETDVAILAVGVEPVTDFLQGACPDHVEKDGGLRVDANLRVCDHIFAAGDVAHVPVKGERVRIEHWRFAEQCGALAARNMLGQSRTYDEVPYFWTYQFDVALDYIGHAKKWDRILIDGDVMKQDFVACYIVGNHIAAVCSAGRPQQTCAIAELMKRGDMPTPEQVEPGQFDYVAAMQK